MAFESRLPSLCVLSAAPPHLTIKYSADEMSAFGIVDRGKWLEPIFFDHEATAELVKRFYANVLQRGMTPAAALRAAQNSIRHEPQWRSPHFWAAFTLQGEYNKGIAPAPGDMMSRPVKIAIALSVLLLLALAVWWYRRSRAVEHTNEAR
jgi:hypothetical protein